MRDICLTVILLLSLAVPALARAQEAISWPLPWKAGTTLTYDKTTVTRKQAKGVEKVRNYSDTTMISITHAAADGYQQIWTSRDARIEGAGAAPAELAVEQEAVRRMSAIPLQVQLDARGLFERINNLAALQTVYRDIVMQGMERSIAQTSAQIDDPFAREQARSRARAANAPMLERLTSEAALNNLVAPQPLSYNYFAVGGMASGQRYEIEDLGENPLGGEALPMLGSVRVAPDPDDARFLIGEWTMALHPQKAAPLLWAAMETLTRAPIAAQDRNGLPSQIDVHTELTVRIERSSGRVDRLRRVETRRVLDTGEVKTTTMVLQR